MKTLMFFTNIPPMGWLIIAVVVLVLFGRGKISSLMGEVGKGITSFKKGMSDGAAELEKAEAETDADADAAKDVTPVSDESRDSTDKS